MSLLDLFGPASGYPQPDRPSLGYAVVTFGCRVNQADSFKIETDLRRRGAREVPLADADLVIVNTCSVTATADQGTRQTIRRIARENSRARIVVTGCYATREPDQIAALPGVVRVLPNSDKDAVLAAIDVELELTTAERFGAGEAECGAAVQPGVMGRTAYPLRVQTGCDERCSYCIIPSTRGRGVSRPVEALRAEVDRAVEAGFKEFAITGVHLGSYGRDLGQRSSLLALLEAIDRWHGGARLLFRVSSLEPMDATPEIVELMTASPRFAPHVHLPLQHASDRVLVAMRRPYTAAYYETLVARIRERAPHAAIGSDLIVGFPGEDDADVERMVEYLFRSPLTYLHIFPYSDRPGTDASLLGPKVPGQVVRARGQALRRAADTLAGRFRASQIGTTRPGLTLEDGTLVVTDNFLKVRIPPGRARNDWVEVRIRGSERGLEGEVE